jgi:HK97 family phage prohead protease
MPRPHADIARRTVTLDTGRRSIDLPVDAAGLFRRVAKLDRSVVTRADGDAGAIGFKGHAAVFSTRTWIGSKRWGFWESLEPGAFTKTIGEADVRMLINHDPNLVLARNTAGTLRLAEDAVGLAVDADMAPTSYGLDLAISLERGDVTQMSFAFESITYEWTVADDGAEWLRHREVKLWDVAPVTYPAYVETDASLRMDFLAAARSSGMSDLDVGELARRLADPDPDLIAALRTIARGSSTPAAPAETTQQDSAPPVGTRDQGPPDDTTGATPIDHRRFATLAQRMALTQGV